MRIDILPLSAELEADYEAFVQRHGQSLFYYGLDYRAALKRMLSRSDDLYLVARSDNNVVGVLPSFIQQGAYGAVLNSLPFYGSNGGPLVMPGADAERIGATLMEELYRLADTRDVVATTLISNPLTAPFPLTAGRNAAHVFQDVRIGQLTPLPTVQDDISNALMALLHQKTRNVVRKGQNGKANIVERTDIATLHEVHSIHLENMREIGGLAKSFEKLKGLFDIYAPKGGLKIYVAEKEGLIAAAVVLLFFRDAVEYYTPVIRAEFRSDQLLSALIFEAMRIAAQEGRRWWNWGGTWKNQEGVYRFKSRWGTIDRDYLYDVRVLDSALLSLTPSDLLREYPDFYVLPFSELKSS